MGIYEKKSEEKPALSKVEGNKEKPVEFIELIGRGVPTVKTAKGLRVAIKGEEIDPQNVEKYLQKKFGVDLNETQLP